MENSRNRMHLICSSSSDSASAEAEQPGLRPRVDLDGAEGQEDDSPLKAEMCVEIHQAAGLKVRPTPWLPQESNACIE
jgi:hypothetical protein